MIELTCHPIKLECHQYNIIGVSISFDLAAILCSAVLYLDPISFSCHTATKYISKPSNNQPTTTKTSECQREIVIYLHWKLYAFHQFSQISERLQFTHSEGLSREVIYSTHWIHWLLVFRESVCLLLLASEPYFECATLTNIISIILMSIYCV